MKVSSIAALLFLTLTAVGEAQRPAARRAPLAGLDQHVAAMMKEWKVPGMAVAIVRGDSILLMKGYGVRKIGETTPVDAHTIFAIGSSSKAFTGAAIGMLADDKKLGFDEPVTTYLPWFEMPDPWVTREIKVRDLLLHRSGLSRGDNLWYGTKRSRTDVVKAIGQMSMATSFRTQFQYQNLMYITAGEVVHEVSGQSWDDFVKARIFAPLGMNESNTSTRDLDGKSNVASPHAELAGKLTVVPWRNIDNAAAAGSINSNVSDMTRWLRLWINGGTFEGKRLLSESTVRQAIAPQFTVNERGMIARMLSPNFLGYGFGWFVEDLRGRRWINHGGNIDGMAALVSFFPEEKIGVVVLTNLNGSDITIPLTANIFDRLIGISPPKDYDTPYRAASRKYDEEQRARRPESVRATGTKPSLPLAAYAGTYRNEFLGTATVREENGKLTIQYDASLNGVGELEHWQYDSFMATMRDPMLGKAPVTFRLGSDGKVSSMNFSLGGDYDWKRE